MRRLLPAFLCFLLVIYHPNQKTSEIKIYELTVKEDLIEIVCAEGVSEAECLGGEKEKREITSVSWEEIENFVIKGPYSF